MLKVLKDSRVKVWTPKSRPLASIITSVEPNYCVSVTKLSEVVCLMLMSRSFVIVYYDSISAIEICLIESCQTSTYVGACKLFLTYFVPNTPRVQILISSLSLAEATCWLMSATKCKYRPSKLHQFSIPYGQIRPYPMPKGSLSIWLLYVYWLYA